MKVERFEQAHQLAEGQLVLDNNQNLWKVHKFLYRDGPYKGRADTWLVDFAGDEYPFTVKLDGETYALGEDAPLPWVTVKVVPDDPDPSAYLTNSSTMCVCGDMQQCLMPGAGNVFAPHTNRKTGEPCPGIPTPGWPRGAPPVPAESLGWVTRRPLMALPKPIDNESEEEPVGFNNVVTPRGPVEVVVFPAWTATPDARPCLAKTPDWERVRVLCTRELGHQGDHATGVDGSVRWPAEDEDDSRE